MSYLNRIIAVDNISKSQILKIPADEHVNFTGINGAGKTTTLRLAPLFFGCKPGDIAKATDKSFESFGVFYFPRPSSYIIYEYVKGDNTYCVVVSSSQQQVFYQFLDAPYQQEYFLDNSSGKTMLCDAAKVRQNVESKGHELTSKMGPSTYAKIIQSNRQYRGKGASASDIRRLRPKYALPRSGETIEGIDRVLLNIFKNKASMASVRSALTNALVQDGIISDSIIRLDERSSQINDWFDAREAWLDLDRRSDMVGRLAQTAADFTTITNKLSGLMAHTLDLKLGAQKFIDENQAESIKNIQQQGAVNKELQEYTTLSAEKETDISQEIVQLDATVKRLLSTKEQFEQGYDEKGGKTLPIEDLKRLYEQEEPLAQVELSAQSFYDEVSKGNQDIVSLYATKRSAVDVVKSQLEKVASEAKVTSVQQFNEEREGVLSLAEESRSKIEGLWAQKISTVSSALNAARGDHIKFTTLLGNLSLPVDDRLLQEELQLDVTNTNKDLLEAISEHSHAQARVVELTTERGQLLEKRVGLATEVAKLSSEQEALVRRRSQGTLFDFLKDGVEGFEANIGKVINPELLEMKGLQPNYKGATDSIFGLEINLDAIPLSEFSDLDSITNQIIKLDEQVAKLEGELEGVDKQLKVVETDLQAAEKKVAVAKIDESTQHGFLKDAEDSLAEHKEKTSAWLELEKQKLGDEVLRVGGVIAKKTQEQKELEQEKNGELQSLKSTTDNELNALHQRHQTVLGQIAEKLVKDLAKQDGEIERLNEQEAKDIEERGFSAETIQGAREALKDAQAAHIKAKKAGPIVARYNAWLAGEWPKYQGAAKSLEQKNHQLESHLEKVKEEKGKFRERLKALAAQNQVCQDNVEIGTKQLQKLTELIRKFENLGIEDDVSRVYQFKTVDYAEALIKFSALKQDYEASQKSGLSDFNILKSTFTRKVGTPTYKFYERLVEEVERSSESSDLWCSCAPALQEYIDGEHVVQADLLRSNYMLVAQSIADFSDVILSTHKELGSLGSKLTKSMEHVTKAFSAIDEIGIEVSSNLKSLSYFSALKDFADEHQSWRVMSGSEMPSDRLISKLTTLIDLLGGKAMEIDVEKSFKIEVRYNDDGKIKIANSDEGIANIASNAVSYLIVISLYIGLINLMRTDTDVRLLFCVDELGAIDPDNSGKLLKVLTELNINLFSALPQGSGEVLQYYPNCFMVTPQKDGRRVYQRYGEDSKKSTYDLVTERAKESV